MAEPAADAAPVRRPKKKILVVGAVVLVLVLALGAGAVVFLKQRAARAAAAADDEAASAETTASATAATHIDPKNVPIYLPLDPFIVNLADREADRYAQIGVTFELESNTASEQIKAYMPAIRNAILMLLANKTGKELMSREGKELLAQEILRDAARPMGIEVAAPEPVTSAAESASAASGAATVKAKPRRSAGAQHNPIVRVHFSSFIIQ